MTSTIFPFSQGKDIVQIGDDYRGLQIRWRFTEITADSYGALPEARSAMIAAVYSMKSRGQPRSVSL
jgi:hypothetical protein